MNIRRKFIVDVVEKYKKDHKQEYEDFKKYTEDSRKLLGDKKFAKVQGVSEMRAAVLIPSGIMNVLEYAMKDERVFEPKGELKWFVKKYPEFLIARSY